MADNKPAGAPAKQVPYPKNWEKMTAGQKRKWLAENRPQTPAKAQPAQPAVAPTPAPAPQQPAPEADEGTTLDEGEEFPPGSCEEEPGDEITVTINVPGQDPQTLSGAEVVRRVLGILYDAFGGAQDAL